MSGLPLTPERIEALRLRWRGQEARLRSIARDLRAGRDWTVHLLGLPHTEEIPPLVGEACGRDLRGADLRHLLRPEIAVTPAVEREAAVVAALAYEGARSDTALPGLSPFALELEGAGEIATAIRRGESFLLARAEGEPVGIARCRMQSEHAALTGGRPYAEISGLAVLPAWRRTGVGSRLLGEAECLSARRGLEHALLETKLETGRLHWYERLGYRVRGVREAVVPGAPVCLEVLMTKPLRVAVAPRVPRRTAASAGRAGVR